MIDADRAYEIAAGGAVSVVVVAWFSVFFDAAAVVDARPLVLSLAVFAAVAGTLARRLLDRTAAWRIAGVGLGLGALVYVLTLPEGYLAATTVGGVLDDLGTFVTGTTMLRIVNLDVWLGVVVALSIFVVTYAVGMRSYDTAAAVAGIPLAIVVLTGDATAATALLGVLGVFGALGLDALASRGGAPRWGRAILSTLVVVLVVTAAFGTTMGGTESVTVDGDTGIGRNQASLVTAGPDLRVGGSIALSEDRRFVVEASAARYWRVGVYDRYTGQGWVRTGDTAVNRRLPRPPGQRERLVQRVRPETTMAVLPAAAQPIAVRGATVGVTELGSADLEGVIEPDATVTVVSSVLVTSEETLAAADGPIPAAVRERYTALPASTSGRIFALAHDIVAAADAETPYQKARAVERYLETTKNYSLTVDRPAGEIAEAFLFQMEAGYCVYYATTAAVLLRAVDVPTRFVVGYTPGTHIGEDRYVVRGLHAHAWIEIYVPNHGWTKIDPTPAGPREAAESAVVSRIESNGDVPGDDGAPDGRLPTTTGLQTASPTTRESDASQNRSAPTPEIPRGGSVQSVNGTSNESWIADVRPDTRLERATSESSPPVWPIVLGLGGLAVAVGALRRYGPPLRPLIALYVPLPAEPGARSVEAYDRIERYLGAVERPRRSRETVREYLRAVDAPRPAWEIAMARERALYEGHGPESGSVRDRFVAFRRQALRLDGDRG